jgi:hypothetical protein
MKTADKNQYAKCIAKTGAGAGGRAALPKSI